MFAVIRSGGKQYRVQEGDILQVEKLDTEEGQKVVFEEVLLIEDGEKTLIGTPFIETAQVRADVIENFKDKKIIVFKKKRRKQYKRKRGHRQELTRVKIEEIIPDVKISPKVVKEKEEKRIPKKEKVKKEAVKREVKEEKPKKEAKKEIKKGPGVRKETKGGPKPRKEEAKAPSKKQRTAKVVSKSRKLTTAKEK